MIDPLMHPARAREKGGKKVFVELKLRRRRLLKTSAAHRPTTIISTVNALNWARKKNW